jgi:hypothetical protein
MARLELLAAIASGDSQAKLGQSGLGRVQNWEEGLMSHSSPGVGEAFSSLLCYNVTVMTWASWLGTYLDKPRQLLCYLWPRVC